MQNIARQVMKTDILLTHPKIENPLKQWHHWPEQLHFAEP